MDDMYSIIAYRREKFKVGDPRKDNTAYAAGLLHLVY